jgi:hypothetical protein
VGFRLSNDLLRAVDEPLIDEPIDVSVDVPNDDETERELISA